jgi:RimJ/RimL family protein N-acetyltransferase
MRPVLADDVIRLEPIGEEHLADLEALGRDPLVAHNTRVPEPWPDGFERTWVDAYVRGREEGTRDGYAIVDADTGTFLGIAGVVDLEAEARQGEIGYALVPAARGRGIATRALRIVTDYALEELGLERVQLNIATDNEASMRVAERCGYRREGMLRSLYVKPGRRDDFAIYSRLPGDD